jgi:hypothetical protein
LSKKCPLGVKILASLLFVDGLIILIGGIDFVSISPFFTKLQFNENSLENTKWASSGFNHNNVAASNATLFLLFSWLIGLVGSVLSAVGCASLIVSWGLLKGKIWAPLMTKMIVIISIVFNAVSIFMGNISGIGGVILSIFSIYYLNKKEVKSYFGRLKAAAG